MQAADVRADPGAHRAWRGTRELELSPKEFDLLELLVRNAGLVVRRERIMSEVWDENRWARPVRSTSTSARCARSSASRP